MNDDIDFGFDQGPHVSRRERLPRSAPRCAKRTQLATLSRSGKPEPPMFNDFDHLVGLCAARRLARKHARTISIHSQYSTAGATFRGSYFDAVGIRRWYHERSV